MKKILSFVVVLAVLFVAILPALALNKGDIIDDEVIKNEIDYGFDAGSTPDSSDDVVTFYENIDLNSNDPGESITLSYGKYDKQKLMQLGLYVSDWLEDNEPGNKNNTGISSFAKVSTVTGPVSVVLYTGPEFNQASIEFTDELTLVNGKNIFALASPNNLTGYMLDTNTKKNTTWNDRVNSILILPEKGYNPPSPPPTGEGGTSNGNTINILLGVSAVLILAGLACVIVGLTKAAKK